MNFATWLAIALCGPGALFVFLWFVADLLRLRRRHRERGQGGGDGGGELL